MLCSVNLFWCFSLSIENCVGGSKSSETSWISLKICDGIISNLYIHVLWSYHFLIWQCCLNDAVRTEVRDVIVWCRHATVIRIEKCWKFSFPCEEQSQKCMHHLALIFMRFKWTWRSNRGTINFLNIPFYFFLTSLVTERAPLVEKMRWIMPGILTFHIKN